MGEVNDLVDNIGGRFFEKVDEQFADLKALGRSLDLLIGFNQA